MPKNYYCCVKGRGAGGGWSINNPRIVKGNKSLYNCHLILLIWGPFVTSKCSG
jgi:hypothetical protein